MTYTIAIDESGRGPVIGPLVMAGVLVNKAQEEELKALGVRDSKLLTPLKREELFDKIKAIVKDHKIIVVYPAELDHLMIRHNLNLIEAMKSVEIIDALDGENVILDCPSVNVYSYASQIKAKIQNKEKDVFAQHKADVKFVSVGAASILAKVTRDRHIQSLKEKYNVDFGSGYMSDQKTQTFIDENFERYPELFRTSWSSWKTRKFNSSQKSLDEF